MVAYHESGHALVTELVQHGEPEKSALWRRTKAEHDAWRE